LELSSFTGQARERGALLISVFDDAYNYMKNGTLLRQVINKINQDIDYNSVETRHLFGDIYEQTCEISKTLEMLASTTPQERSLSLLLKW